MLYERWQKIADQRAREIAVHDLASGQRWTFQRLASLARASNRPASSLQFPQLDARPGQPRIERFLLAVLAGWRDRVACCPLEPDQSHPVFKKTLPGIAHFKTTSATTGAPRFVAFTEEQLAADCDNIVATMGLRAEWPNLAVLSLAHSYGFSNVILPLLLHGIPIIFAPSPLPDAILKAARTAPDLTLPAVPALWRAWLEAGAIPPNVRLAISAGAPLPLALEQELFARSGLKVHNFYGATECGGIAYDTSSTPRADAACVGAPMVNVRLRTNAEGCLEVRGPAVGAGYWPEPDANLRRGCFRTSDLAEIRDGLVCIRGRASDLINVAGRKVSPETIERAVQAHPGVRDCLVFGAPAPDSQRAEQIVACVVAQPGVTVETLRSFLLDHLPAWQLPRDWRFVDSLAPNQRGKLSRAEWRTRLGFDAGAASTSRPATQASLQEPALARSPAFRRQDVRPAKAGTPCQEPSVIHPIRRTLHSGNSLRAVGAQKTFVGIEIGGTKLQVVVGDESAAILERQRFVVDRAKKSRGIRQQLKGALDDLITKWKPVAIGVGFGGPVEWRTGRIARSHHVEGWAGVELGQWLSGSTRLPVRVDNDANVAALGESSHGAGAGFNPVFYVTLGSGVGGGLVVDGRIYHGAGPGESELGHVRLDRKGTIVEDRCSGWAVDAKIRRLKETGAHGALCSAIGRERGGESKHLARALKEGDAAAQAILSETAQDLAFGLSHAVHLFHPEVIVLGGGLSLVGEPLRAAVAAALPGFLMEVFQPGPEVRLAALGEYSVPVGALILARENVAV
jgi:predicted NBD/HSP70 family sugar kinase